MNCEMCGRNSELFKTTVEGITLNVCETCSVHGKVFKRIQPEIKVRKKKQQNTEEEVDAVVENYAVKIRKAREKKGLTQKEFAIQIQQKESLLQKMEIGQFEPSIPLARKLEKILRIKLVESQKIKSVVQVTKNTGSFTIGDLIKK